MSVKMYGGGVNLFEAGCKLAQLPPTKRQFKKWQKGKGKAFAESRELTEEQAREVVKSK